MTLAELDDLEEPDEDELHIKRCSVCGNALMLTPNKKASQSSGFCIDTYCRYYPPTTTSRSEDPTLAAYVAFLVDVAEIPARRVSLLMDANPSWAASVASWQRKHWQRHA